MRSTRFASTRRSTWSSSAWAPRARLRLWRRARQERTYWPSNVAAGPGGTSAHSGGLIYLGGGTALQSACGFQDSPENMAAFLRAALGPGVDDDRVDAYCEGSPDHFDWLVSIGVPFRAAFCDEPNRESADDAGLLFSGGEDTYPV